MTRPRTLPQLPHNLEAERAVLGAVFLNDKAMIVFDSVLPSDFFLREHQTIARRMLAMRTQNRVVDLLTLTDELNVADELEAAGGTPYIAALADGLPKATNFEHYGRIVKENSLLRELMRMAHETEQAAQSGTGAPALLDQLSSQISVLRYRTNGTRTGFRLTALGELLQEREEQVRWVLKDRNPCWPWRGSVGHTCWRCIISVRVSEQTR